MKKATAILSVMIAVCSGTGCTQSGSTTNPEGYDLANPLVYKMPVELDEVSGIAFNSGNADTVFAHNDEEGKLFYFHPGSTDMKEAKFARKGDYEDIAICNGYVVVLRSDGALIVFSLNSRDEKEPGIEYAGLLAEGEYEGMYADEKSNTIYVLCKNCAVDKKASIVSGYTLQLGADGKPLLNGNFSIDVSSVAAMVDAKKITLRPSAIARNKRTGEWYILSSVSKLLLVTDDQWKTKAVHQLDPAVFTQPEGMAFDKDDNLYISNEKAGGATGTILKFAYRNK